MKKKTYNNGKKTPLAKTLKILNGPRGFGQIFEFCHQCMQPSKNHCYVYQGKRKICFLCYAIEKESKRKLIEMMPDINPEMCYIDGILAFDLGRIDRLWDSPVSYSQDQ